MVKAPFILIQQGRSNTGTLWHLAGYGPRKPHPYSNLPRVKMAAIWDYAPVQYLGVWQILYPETVIETRIWRPYNVH